MQLAIDWNRVIHDLLPDHVSFDTFCHVGFIMVIYTKYISVFYDNDVANLNSFKMLVGHKKNNLLNVSNN